MVATSALARTISSVTSATVVVLTATISTTTAETVTNTSLPVGAGANALSQGRGFFAEAGAPADHTPVWAPKSATYRLLGAMSSITGLAISAGMSYEDAYARLKMSLLMVTMLNEENALLNSSSTALTPPWGDGSTALGYAGMREQISSSNGTPAIQIGSATGPLTMSAIDAMLIRLWEQGGTGPFMICSGTEIASLTHLAEAAGSIIRVQATTQADAILGMRVTGYKHPVTGDIVDVIPSRFLPGAMGNTGATGEIIFGSRALPDGTAAAEVDVLPQLPLASLQFNQSGNQMLQGYTVMDIAPDATAPHLFAMVCALYSVLKLKSSAHFAKLQGISAV